jgi:UDP-N-acetylmuramate dehydrogenase
MSISIVKNYPLDKLNTFNISANAKFFYEFKTLESLKEILNHKLLKTEKSFVLGGGSNILISNDFDGVVLKNSIRGIHITKENTHHTEVEVGSGENWHEFVLWCVKKNLSGVENLALIPGSVGASPIQNIGAYGCEAKDTIKKVQFIDLKSKTIKELTNSECDFSYRSSIFKKDLKEKCIITKVTFLLNKTPINNTSYGAITSELAALKSQASPQSICNAVINIRSRKLPDPQKIGNSGSFFKNPIISNKKLKKIRAEHPEIVNYKYSKTHSKIAAGWLIEMAGWKGYRKDDFGVYDKQALVLVNYGNASGNEIIELSKKIQYSVNEKFDIKIYPEVNII